MLTAFLFQFISNVLFLVVYCRQIVDKDPVFKYWRDAHRVGHPLILACTLIFSYNSIRLIVCRLFNIKLFSAEFRDKSKLYKILLKLGFLTLFCSCIPMIAAQTLLLYHYPISNWLWMATIDSLVITVLYSGFLIMGFFQMEKECLQIECLLNSGKTLDTLIEYPGLIEAALVRFPYYDFKKIVPSLDVFRKKGQIKNISKSPPPERSTDPMPVEIQARRKMSFPLEVGQEIEIDQNLFPSVQTREPPAIL